MSDLVSELRWFSEKKKWPKGLEGMPELLAKAADALSPSTFQPALNADEVLSDVKNFAHWHHLNEWTLKNGRKPSDSEIDFEAEAYRKIEKALKCQSAPSVAVRAGKPKLPPLGNELYEYYPSMSAQTHAEAVKDYARDAVDAALSARVQDVAGLGRLRDVTYAVQHNPNCPAKYLVRLVGKSGRIDLKPYGNHLPKVKHETSDVLGFGKTLDEAIDNAIAAKAADDGR